MAATRASHDMVEGACQPAWSPDGARLVFISPCIRNQESTWRRAVVVNEDALSLRRYPLCPVAISILAGHGWQIYRLYLVAQQWRPRIYVSIWMMAPWSVFPTVRSDKQPSWSRMGKKLLLPLSIKVFSRSDHESGWLSRIAFSLSGPKIIPTPSGLRMGK